MGEALGWPPGKGATKATATGTGAERGPGDHAPQRQERCVFFKLNYQQTAFPHLGPEWARHRGWGSRRAQGAVRPEAELPAGPRWASEALLLSLLRPRLASWTARRSRSGQIPGIVFPRGPAHLGVPGTQAVGRGRERAAPPLRPGPASRLAPPPWTEAVPGILAAAPAWDASSAPRPPHPHPARQLGL